MLWKSEANPCLCLHIYCSIKINLFVAFVFEDPNVSSEATFPLFHLSFPGLLWNAFSHQLFMALAS